MHMHTNNAISLVHAEVAWHSVVQVQREIQENAPHESVFPRTACALNSPYNFITQKYA